MCKAVRANSHFRDPPGRFLGTVMCAAPGWITRRSRRKVPALLKRFLQILAVSLSKTYALSFNGKPPIFAFHDVLTPHQTERCKGSQPQHENLDRLTSTIAPNRNQRIQPQSHATSHEAKRTMPNLPADSCQPRKLQPSQQLNTHWIIWNSNQTGPDRTACNGNRSGLEFHSQGRNNNWSGSDLMPEKPNQTRGQQPQRNQKRTRPQKSSRNMWTTGPNRPGPNISEHWASSCIC